MSPNSEQNFCQNKRHMESPRARPFCQDRKAIIVLIETPPVCEFWRASKVDEVVTAVINTNGIIEPADFVGEHS